uniref:Carboxylesterase 18 n=1 Tax=Meteorus pulchricornis TaxID=51522 RepID=A0A4D6J5W1_9HYME|nr:carboxylesterase 18 [Meteorus pulchricornis]
MASVQRLSLHVFTSIIILVIATQVNCSIRKKRIVGGIHAAQPPEDDPVVFVSMNNRDSRVNGERDPDKGFYVFKGIRFGEPPIGRNRFQRARAVHLNGEYNATQWGPPCPQMHGGKIIGSEDCLFLNVFTPELPDSSDGYPVLIWIHGGGFKIGAACQYEMRNLIKKKMIVVSIQYRLGSLGFLSTGSPDLPGNNGMFDMLLAVNWVKQYIKYFGGNPTKLIAAGHGTGASAALMLSLSKLTNNFFSGLIAMSGSLLSSFALDKDPMSSSKRIAMKSGCPIDNVTSMVHCLQQLPIEMIIRADSDIANMRLAAEGFLSAVSALLVPGPVVEGNDDLRSLPNFMTDSPENSLKFGKLPRIPLLTGVMNDEAGGAVRGGYSNQILDKIRKTPNYVNEELIKNLQGTIPIFENTSRQFIPKAFDQYLNDGGARNLKTSLTNVAKAVNDAIFNVPVFLMMKYWSQNAKTFFYSFDYKSKEKRRNNFLTGLPIVDAENSSKGDNQGHGDDLFYIFGESNDIYGNKINGSKKNNKDEERVSNIFIDMIVQFARVGIVSDERHPKVNNISSVTNPTDDNTFFSITNKLKPVENFKFCEVALWTGAVQDISSSVCDSIRVTTETVARLTTETKNIVNLANSSIDTITNLGNVGNKVVSPNITSSIPEIPTFGVFG